MPARRIANFVAYLCQHTGVNRAEKTYYVYILASQLHGLYISATSNIELRVRQHKVHWLGGFF
jgi:hypothetical protein